MPSSEMSVRGTHFAIGMDMETGDSWISVFSGIVEGEKRDRNSREQDSNEKDNHFEIYPSQEAYIFSDIDEESPPPAIVMVDLDQFVERVGEDVIRQLLQDRDEIDRENDQNKEMIGQALGNQGFLAIDTDSNEISEEEQERLERNLDNLITNIFNQVIQNNRIDEEEVNQIIEEINQRQPVRSIDLDELELSEELQGERVRQENEELKHRQQERERQLEEERKRREEIQSQNQDLIKRLVEQRKSLEEENNRAQEKAEQEAQDKYLNQLEKEERKRFKEEQRKRLEERQRAEEERKKREDRQQQRHEQEEKQEESSNDNVSPPSNGGSTPPIEEPDPEPSEAVASLSAIGEQNNDGAYIVGDSGDGLTVTVNLRNIENVAAMQIHLTYAPNLISELVTSNQELFDDLAVEDWKAGRGIDESESEQVEMVYSIVNNADLETIDIGESQNVLQVLFYGLISDLAEGSIQLKKLIAVTGDGEEIPIEINEDSINYEIEWTPPE